MIIRYIAIGIALSASVISAAENAASKKLCKSITQLTAEITMGLELASEIQKNVRIKLDLREQLHVLRGRALGLASCSQESHDKILADIACCESQLSTLPRMVVVAQQVANPSFEEHVEEQKKTPEPVASSPA